MKKCISYVLTIMLVFTLIACGEKGVKSEKEKDSFDIKIASATVEEYIKSIKKGDYDEANKLLADGMKTNKEKLTTNDLRITGYKILEMSEVNQEAIVKVEIIKSKQNSPHTVIMSTEVNVKKQGKEYKLSKINSEVNKEIFYINGMLRLKKEDEVDTNLVLDMQGIPNYAYTKDDKGKMKMQIVPKTQFGILEFGYEGNKVAITTFDKNSFIGIVKLDDTMVTQGQNDKNENESQEKVGGKVLKEVPIGKQITVCDILNDAKINGIYFSTDEEYLIVQYNTKGNAQVNMRIYDVSNGQLVPVLFEEEYPLNKVTVTFGGFNEEKLVYKVAPKTDKDKNNEYVGTWEMNLNNFKMKKVK